MRRLTTVPGLGDDASTRTIELLQHRLVALLDLQLTLKHIHWNVVGVNFIRSTRCRPAGRLQVGDV
ncbi:MAG: hypothetical protein R2697_19390 [Ilumatobacteraceae bacterium]